jgi:AsmA protein
MPASTENAMPKVLKYLLIAFLALIALLVLAMAIVAATFNPNDYKPTLIKLVQEKTQRSLSIPGDIKLTFFPRVGADLGKVAISERGSAKDFASAQHAKVSVALLPIFSKRFVVDRVLVDGLTVNLHRYSDNTSNYDDLLSKSDARAAPAAPEPEKSHAVMLDVGGIAITNARLSLIDDARHSTLSVSKLDLSTGPIADGKKSSFEFSAELKGNKPAIALNLSARSGFTLDLAQQRYALENFAATVNGAALDISSLNLKLSIPSLDLSPKAFKAPALSLDASVTQGARTVTATLGGALSGDLENQRFEFDSLSTELALPNPAGGTLAISAKGKASVNLAREAVQAALAGKLDTTSFDAKVSLTKFAQPAFGFDIALGDIDADRYLAKDTPAKPRPAAGPEQAIDLSPLKSLNAKGTLKVASLKVLDLRAADIHLELHANGGKVDVNPMSATLYGGNLAGALSASAGTPQRFAAKQNLRGINLGPLLKDAIGKAPVDGKGDVALDISATGATVTQLKKTLNGTASLLLKDGAVNGINLAATIRKAKASLGMGPAQPTPQQGTASAQDKTDFTELSGSFKISNGIAHNDDLSAKTPLFRLGGSGDINLGEGSLDYTVKAAVVPTLEGQGGPELQELKGLTVPVKLSGPFTAIGWKIDYGAIAAGRAKALVDERKEQIKAEAQKKIDAQKEQIQEQLKGQLKGLFGK